MSTEQPIAAVVITKEDVLQAMTEWNRSHRAGECMSHEESDAVPDEQAVQERADYLWSLLSA